MYILTENREIINSDNYRIAVSGNSVTAYLDLVGGNKNGFEVPIISFNAKTHAEVALAVIFQCLMDEKKFWIAGEYKNSQ